MNYTIAIILFTITILILVFLKRQFISKFTNYNSKINNLTRQLSNYISYFSKYEISFKTNNKLKNLDPKEILKFYQDNIYNFTHKEIKILKKSIKIINKRFNYNFLKKNWNFIKISDDIEKSMPFTLGKYIFLPEKFLNIMTQNKKIPDFILETLIHEKIHIFQRYNYNLFKQFYTQNLGIIFSDSIKIKSYWQKQHLKNPDGLDITWIYYYKNKYYLPLLLFNQKRRDIKQVFIELKKTNHNQFYTTNIFKNFNNFNLFDFDDSIAIYHPNEITAYIISKMIVYKKFRSSPRYKQFNNILNYLKNIYV